VVFHERLPESAWFSSQRGGGGRLSGGAKLEPSEGRGTAGGGFN
jgi:hypothetical protein